MSESPSRISVRPPATNVCFSRMGSRAGSRLSFNWNHNTERQRNSSMKSIMNLKRSDLSIMIQPN